MSKENLEQRKPVPLDCALGCLADSADDQQILREWRAYRKAVAELNQYFTSGNSIPGERATILAKDFWRIIGAT